MSKSEDKRRAVQQPGKVERFYRIAELDYKPGDSLRGYQAEEIEVVGDTVVARRWIGKPNLFEYAQTGVIDLMDPRNARPIEAE